MWKSIIKSCQLCFQIVARFWSLLTTCSATTPVHPGHHCLLCRPLQWLLSHFSLAPSLFAEYSEWSFENVCHCSAQNPLLVFQFTWDKIQTLYQGLQSPFLSPWPICLLLSPLPTLFHLYWSSSSSLNTMYLRLPQDLCTCYFSFLKCGSFRYLPLFILLRSTGQFNREGYLFWLFNLKEHCYHSISLFCINILQKTYHYDILRILYVWVFYIVYFLLPNEVSLEQRLCFVHCCWLATRTGPVSGRGSIPIC